MKDNIIDTDQVLRMFSEDKTPARRLYRGFMNEGINIKKDDLYRTVDQRILGGENFVDKVRQGGHILTFSVFSFNKYQKKYFGLFHITE